MAKFNTPLLLSLVFWNAAHASEPDPQGTPLPEINPADVVSTTTYDLGDHYLTVEEVSAAALPAPPKATTPPVTQPSSPRPPAAAPGNFQFIGINATVYLGNPANARSLVTYHPPGGGIIGFWSSADWRLFTGVDRLQGDDGRSWGLFMAQTTINTGRAESPPIPEDIPQSAAAGTTFIITEGEATPAEMELIRTLHTFYDTNHANLLAASNARAQEQAAPPAPTPIAEDITVRVRILTPEEINGSGTSE